LAARIRDATGVDAELVRGERGIFDVVVDGRLLFSKHESGRFPDPDEILSALASA
jgi:selenoprotein W-related protein